MKSHDNVFSIIHEHKQVSRCRPHGHGHTPLTFPPLHPLSIRWPPLSFLSFPGLGGQKCVAAAFTCIR